MIFISLILNTVRTLYLKLTERTRAAHRFLQYCKDTRPYNHLMHRNSAKISATSFKEPQLPSTPSFWEWVAPSTTITRWSLILRVKKRKNSAGSEKHCPHQLRKRSHFGTEYRKAPPPPKRKGKINGDQEGCRLGLKPVTPNLWQRRIVWRSS